MMSFITPFRSAAFRNRDRDRRTDAERLGRLRTSVATALADVTAETSALKRRVELLRGRTGDLLGTGEGSGIEREPDHEAELLGAEHRLLAGLRRLDQLEDSHRFLSSLRHAIETRIGHAAVALTLGRSATGDLSPGR